jgi:ribosomal protein L32
MIFAFINSPKQQEELKQAISDAKEVKWYKRLKIIQLSSTGKSVRKPHRRQRLTVPQLSVEFDLCPLTIRHYVCALCSYNTDLSLIILVD